MEDILLEKPETKVKYFVDNGKFDGSVLLQIIESGDQYSVRIANNTLALVFAYTSLDASPFIDSIFGQISDTRSKNSSFRFAVSSLCLLLRNASLRRPFAQHGGIGYLTKLLKLPDINTYTQLPYDVCFSLWVLSFDVQTQPEFSSAFTIQSLVDQVTANPREKVIRVALAALRNLCESPSSQLFVGDMINTQLLKVLKNLKDRQWADQDVADDIDKVYTILINNYHELSTFEKYQAEVYSGQLRNGVIHSEKFWKENCKALEHNDFQILKVLIKMLRESKDDEETMSVICYDIGEFVRFYPNGKAIVKLLGGKDLIMRLIDHPNADIQRNALQCVSKIMVSNWEFVK